MRCRLIRCFFLLVAVFFLCRTFYAQAASAASDAPAQDPIARANTLLELGKADEALALLKPLASAQPPVKGLQHELGLISYRTGKLEDADKAFTAAVAENPDDRESVQLEGLTLYRLGRPAAAIPYLERVRGWMPAANADATYVLGLCYLNARRYDDARKAFAAQFGVPPDSPSANLLLGTMLRHANLPELAAIEAEKALAKSPSQPLAHFMLGEIALLKSDIPTAIRELEAERDVNVDYAPLYWRLGDAYLRVERLEDSQQALTRAIALDTNLTGAFTLMGKLLLRKQDTQTAIMYLQHAEKMDPNDATVHYLLSQAYHHMGKEEDARRESAAASKIHADNQLRLGPSN